MTIQKNNLQEIIKEADSKAFVGVLHSLKGNEISSIMMLLMFVMFIQISRMQLPRA